MNDAVLAERIGRLLNDESFKDVVERLRVAYQTQWLNTTSEMGRESLWHQATALGDLLRTMEVIRDNKLFEEAIEQSTLTKKGS